MNYAVIKWLDIANGPGIRISLFVSGCELHCPECFNKIAWDFNYGEEFTFDIQKKIMDKMESNSVYKGLSILGGEPLNERNQMGLLPFVKSFREKFPDKDIWVFTGYTWDNIPGDREILQYIDVLVDGPFQIKNKDLRLVFKGSSNQRTIDVQKSLKERKVIILEGY